MCKQLWTRNIPSPTKICVAKIKQRIFNNENANIVCVCVCELFYSELSCPPKKDISCVAEDESNVIMSITSLTADNATECGGESKLINITKICRIGMFFACRPVY